MKYHIKEMRVEYRKGKTIDGGELTSPKKVYEWWRELEDEGVEKFISVFLNSKKRVLCFSVCFEGTVYACTVFPREIVKKAILCNATGLVLIHNHPSGSVAPSEDDRAITRQIQDACKLLEIVVLDHIIIGEEGFYSFAEKGII